MAREYKQCGECTTMIPMCDRCKKVIHPGERSCAFSVSYKEIGTKMNDIAGSPEISTLCYQCRDECIEGCRKVVEKPPLP